MVSSRRLEAAGFVVPSQRCSSVIYDGAGDIPNSCHRMEYRCVRCGFRVKTLYVQYSPRNIRLIKCDNCKVVADKYIEGEFMILLVDLILHKSEAYRHLLFNVLKQKTPDFEGLLWKSILSFLLLDSYAYSLEEAKMNTNPLQATLYYLGHFKRCWLRDLLLAVMISSYLKIFLIAMMVWEFPPLVIFIIDLFVLSSNAVAVKGRPQDKPLYCSKAQTKEPLINASDDDCCNSCEEVSEAYRKKGWVVTNVDLIDQCKREGFIQKVKDEEGEGCNIHGSLEVNKVAGNFHFIPGKSFHLSNFRLLDLMESQKNSYNITHKINNLSFGDYFPGVVNPLDGGQFVHETSNGMH